WRHVCRPGRPTGAQHDEQRRQEAQETHAATLLRRHERLVKTPRAIKSYAAGKEGPGGEPPGNTRRETWSTRGQALRPHVSPPALQPRVRFASRIVLLAAARTGLGQPPAARTTVIGAP